MCVRLGQSLIELTLYSSQACKIQITNQLLVPNTYKVQKDIYWNKTQHANFEGNPLYQANKMTLKQQLNGRKWFFFKWDGERSHLSVLWLSSVVFLSTGALCTVYGTDSFAKLDHQTHLCLWNHLWNLTSLSWSSAIHSVGVGVCGCAHGSSFWLCFVLFFVKGYVLQFGEIVHVWKSTLSYSVEANIFPAACCNMNAVNLGFSVT